MLPIERHEYDLTSANVLAMDTSVFLAEPVTVRPMFKCLFKSFLVQSCLCNVLCSVLFKIHILPF